MSGQEFQDKIDAIVEDLQTRGRGQSVNIVLRNADNAPVVFTVSSNSTGVVDGTQLRNLEDFVSILMPLADGYEAARIPVEAALGTFKTAQIPHTALVTAATAARATLNTALEADATYQTAKTALTNARNLPAYISAVAQYKENNLSENFGNLGDAKGKYEV